jgi:hypothetical protein
MILHLALRETHPKHNSSSEIALVNIDKQSQHGMAASHPRYSEESCAPPSKLGGGGSFVIVSSANHALHRVNSAGANTYAKLVPNGIELVSVER